MRRAVIRRAVICWLVLGGLGSRLTEAVRSGVVVGGPAVDELLDGCVHFLTHRAEPQPSVVATREGHDFNLTGFTFVHVPVATCYILLTQFCMEVNFAVLCTVYFGHCLTTSVGALHSSIIAQIKT